MPRYDYRCAECGDITELVHSISHCDVSRICLKCGGTLTRCVNAPHIDGSNIYPFNFWNAKLPGGKFAVEVRSKSEHKALLESRGLDSPVLAKWGTNRIRA